MPKYYSNSTLTFLVASLLTPVRPPELYDDKENLTDFLGSGERAESFIELDRSALKLLLLFSYGRACADQYRSFFTSYLHAPARSGHNVFDSKRYTAAALECLKYLHKDRDRGSTTSTPIPKLFPWALQCLPILLDRAAITDALLKAVRRHKFSRRTNEFKNDESAAQLGISRLLSRGKASQ